MDSLHTHQLLRVREGCVYVGGVLMSVVAVRQISPLLFLLMLFVVVGVKFIFESRSRRKKKKKSQYQAALLFWLVGLELENGWMLVSSLTLHSGQSYPGTPELPGSRTGIHPGGRQSGWRSSIIYHWTATVWWDCYLHHPTSVHSEILQIKWGIKCFFVDWENLPLCYTAKKQRWQQHHKQRHSRVFGEMITRQAYKWAWEPTQVLLHLSTSPSPRADASGSAHADPTGLKTDQTGHLDSFNIDEQLAWWHHLTHTYRI